MTGYSNAANDHESGLINCFCGNFNQIWISPEFLRLYKANPMLFQVSSAFLFIEFEREHGIKNIPLLEITQGVGMSCGFSTVGMPVAWHPPCRPGRAVFPHPVPRLYSLARSKTCVSCHHRLAFAFSNTWLGYLYSFKQQRERGPVETSSLTAASIEPFERTVHSPPIKTPQRV